MKIIDDWFDKQFKKMAKLRESLDKPDRLMKKIGALAVGESQKAFENQALGNIQWPERYPGMKPPFLNVAGALQDFNAGRKAPKPNRFQDRPALVDEGQRGGIWGSLTFKLTGNHSVEAGSNKPYANTHQEGAEKGEVFITVTQTARDGIKDWLYTSRGKVRSGRDGYVPKLKPLLSELFYTQKILARPFVGVTDDFEQDAIAETKDFFERI